TSAGVVRPPRSRAWAPRPTAWLSGPPGQGGRSEQRPGQGVRPQAAPARATARSRIARLPGLARTGSSAPSSLDCAPMQSDSEGLLDLCCQFRPGARGFGAAQILEQLARELERTPTAARLVEQAPHATLLEP